MTSGGKVDGHMAKTPRRPKSLPQFGQALSALRQGVHLSMGQVVAAMHRRHVAFEGFSLGQLSRYESGRLKDPSLFVMYHLADLYGGDLVDLARIASDDREKWFEHKTAMVESAHIRGGSSHGPSGTSVVAPGDAAETRVLQALTDDLQPITHRQDHRARAGQARRKRTPGKGRR